MLKWFRKYNKIILAVGCVVLMVAFLIPQAVSMFSPKPQERVVGTMNGQEVKVADLNQAGAVVQVMQELFRGTLLAERLVPYEREQWLMIQKDAERLGLDASNAEVNGLLEGLGVSPEDLDTRAREKGASAGFFREAVRQWLVSEQYRMLISGRRYDSAIALSSSPGLTTLNLWTNGILPQVNQVLSMQEDPRYAQAVLQAAEFQFLGERLGHGRISPPALDYVMANELERVGGRAVMIEAKADEDLAVDDTQVRRLYEEYKEFLPGTGSPYPLGYRQPVRVKVEYLAFPAEAALSAVKVEPLDVLDFYRENKDRFTDAEGGPAPDMPPAAVREQIEQGLQLQMASELMRRAVAEARAALDDDVRAFETVGGYKVLPEDFRPIPLEEVSDRVAQNAGLTPQRTDAEGWVALSELREQTDGYGGSVLPGGSATAAAYLSLAQELRTDETPPAARVQVGVATAATQGRDGTFYIARLVDAQPAQAPESLGAVRAQVEADARRVAAYERLVEQADGLAERAAADGMDALAAAFGTEVNEVSPIPRRAGGSQVDEGRQAVPPVPGVGRSPALIDAVFGVVADVPLGADVATALSARQRTVSTPIDRALGVAVFEVTEYTPPTRQAFDQLRQMTRGVTPDLPLMGDIQLLNTLLSEESLASRVGYDLDADEEDESADAKGMENVEDSGA